MFLRLEILPLPLRSRIPVTVVVFLAIHGELHAGASLITGGPQVRNEINPPRCMDSASTPSTRRRLDPLSSTFDSAVLEAISAAIIVGTCVSASVCSVIGVAPAGLASMLAVAFDFMPPTPRQPQAQLQLACDLVVSVAAARLPSALRLSFKKAPTIALTKSLVRQRRWTSSATSSTLNRRLAWFLHFASMCLWRL
ncbi:hypothetical protein SEVIR_9G317201v4 [Setaria viridis]|uniref:Uncharacterized protein n=1 Tax=Setaria viridis TaxID=4556 RepID=A0A4U6T2W1_SETVI|nr:hypothetical protein SEVIR_9G317201v2 [Setaria viridis]